MKNRLFIVGLFFVVFSAQSQVAITNKGVLYISSNADIFYSGSDLTNTSSASLTNNGSLYVKGNIINDQSSMPVGTGTLFLNGSSAQTLSGSQPFRVYNLNTNNSAGITLNANLSISGTHTFSSGIITTSSTPNYLIYESGASYTGTSDTKHVSGWVKKIGSNNFVFPVGANTYLREIALQNLSGASEFDVQYSGATSNATSVLSPIVSMNPMEQWTVNKITGGSAQVQLNWDNSKVPFPNYNVPDLRAALYSGSQWINQGGIGSGSANTTGTVTSSSISSFGKLSIGSISVPLPVNFVSISATVESSSVRVKWTTADEVSVENYTVQRSSDGINFTNLVIVSAKNGSLQAYEYLDLMPSSKLYYRILSKDYNGNTAYSAIVIVRLDNVQRMSLLDNPVRNAVHLSTQNMPSTRFSYHLVSMSGQICKRGSFTSEGSTITSLAVSNLKPGTYTLVVTRPGEEKRFKLLIQ